MELDHIPRPGLFDMPPEIMAHIFSALEPDLMHENVQVGVFRICLLLADTDLPITSMLWAKDLLPYEQAAWAARSLWCTFSPRSFASTESRALLHAAYLKVYMQWVETSALAWYITTWFVMSSIPNTIRTCNVPFSPPPLSPSPPFL